MAKSEIERTVQQSLLDRLIDLDPRSSVEPAMTWAQSVRQLKYSLRRDLEWLLNTRRTIDLAGDELPEVRRSLHHYGVPDITSLGRDSADERVRLLRWVEETVSMFEPRLSNVHVTLGESDGAEKRELHFIIEGLLRLDPTPEQVVFDTVLEITSGEYLVKGTAGA
jgi:type VI secretion system protein ImpF